MYRQRAAGVVPLSSSPVLFKGVTVSVGGPMVGAGGDWSVVALIHPRTADDPAAKLGWTRPIPRGRSTDHINSSSSLGVGPVNHGYFLDFTTR